MPVTCEGTQTTPSAGSHLSPQTRKKSERAEMSVYAAKNKKTVQNRYKPPKNRCRAKNRTKCPARRNRLALVAMPVYGSGGGASTSRAATNTGTRFGVGLTGGQPAPSRSAFRRPPRCGKRSHPHHTHTLAYTPERAGSARPNGAARQADKNNKITNRYKPRKIHKSKK